MKGSKTLERKKSTTPHYQTFPTAPPKSKGRPPSKSPPESESGGRGHGRHASNTSNIMESPLPTKQLIVLAIIALSEQTALNSISPYLPQMASSFPEVDAGEVGVYVGTIASAYALAQFMTNFFWGWLSDRVGRKPVILIGTLLTAVGFVAFGFCRTLWQAILVQTFMGLANGNQGVISTCLGEITDRSNQSKAFTYLPVIYGLGGITGPIVGGLLVSRSDPANDTGKNPYPYLPPNLFSAGVLVIDMIVTMLYLEESLDEARDLPPLGKRVSSLFAWAWQFASSSRPSYLRIIPHHHSSTNANGDAAMDEDHDASDSDSASQFSIPVLFPHHTEDLTPKQVFSRDTIFLLLTYLLFQLSNISFNSLYPIFASAQPPRGRNLSPSEIGLSLAFAGVVTILFQIGFFGRLRDKMGNKSTYRAGLAGLAIAFFLMPWVGYKDTDNGEATISSGELWLWIELGTVLLIKTVAGVSGLTSALLLVGCFSLPGTSKHH